MAPIRLGDGTGITSIRLGDGTQISEVRTGAGDVVFTSVPDGAFDLTQLTFDTSISTQDSEPRDVVFNNDGTRMYECGFGSGGDIYQSTLSTPFEITTATFDTSINTQGASTLGIALSDDGSRLYEANANPNPGFIFQSDLSTPFDIDTATFDTSISSQDAFPEGIAWNDDGSRLYEVGADLNNIYQYTL